MNLCMDSILYSLFFSLKCFSYIIWFAKYHFITYPFTGLLIVLGISGYLSPFNYFAYENIGFHSISVFFTSVKI